jgi:hypothetical protein
MQSFTHDPNPYETLLCMEHGGEGGGIRRGNVCAETQSTAKLRPEGGGGRGREREREPKPNQ